MSRRGVVIVNPASGPDETSPADLAAHFPGAELLETDGSDLERLVTRAVSDGCPVVGVAGGDGTIRCAASVLAGSGVALLPIPAGTRNHFARELGIDTLERATEAWEGSDTRQVDLAEVNGERFVNNSSIGFYAALVRERETHERNMPKRLANVRAAWAQARRGHRFRVRLDGQPFRAWIVFVGNGCYGERLTDLMARQSLDDNTLDVRLLRADGRLARTRAVVAILLGRSGRSPLLETRTCDELTIELERRTTVDAALDGEVVRLDNPLHYRSLASALVVRVPPVRDGC